MPFFTWKGHNKEQIDSEVQSMLDAIRYPEQRGKPFMYKVDRKDTYMDAMDKEKRRAEYRKMREVELRKDLALSHRTGHFGPDGPGQLVCELGQVAEFTAEGLQPKIARDRLLKLRHLAGRTIIDAETGEVKGLRPIEDVEKDWGWVEVNEPPPAPEPEPEQESEPETHVKGPEEMSRDEYVRFYSARMGKDDVVTKAEAAGLKPDARKNAATLLGEIYDAEMGE